MNRQLILLIPCLGVLSLSPFLKQAGPDVGEVSDISSQEAIAASPDSTTVVPPGEQGPAEPPTVPPVDKPAPPEPSGPPLLAISISPESRVKADAPETRPSLEHQAWTEFSIEIENAARMTAPLVIESEQAMRGDDDDHRDRWLKIALQPPGPLTGASFEKRVLRLWSRDEGKRAAVLHVNTGQGTQDLGFRSDVLLVFDVEAPDETAALDRAEAENLLDLFLFVLAHEPTDLREELVETAWQLHDQWLRHPKPLEGSGADLLQQARTILAKLLPRLLVVDLASSPSQPLPMVRGLPRVVVVRERTASGRDHFTPYHLTASESPLAWVHREAPLTLPVELTEPATVHGVLHEGNHADPFPGRLRALGSDGILRKGVRFEDNATLSEKNLLPFIFTGRGANYALPFFYSDGRFEVKLPPGEATLTLERGFEHPLVTQSLRLEPGETRELKLRSERFLDPTARGWFSGDTHIHWAKNWWSEEEDIKLLAMVQRAEDLRVVNNLTLKHHTRDQDFLAPTQFPMGPIPGLCDADYHAQQAEEYRNEEFYGHIILLNIKRLIEPVSTGSMGGPPHFWDWPPNTHAIEEARRQGGISIEAHGLGRNNDVPVNVAQGLSDSLDQMPPEDYYRFLDCGFQIPLSNGSDHPARVAGCCRVYVKTELPFTYERWIQGIRRNRTFTTSGPLLFLTANDREVGEVLDLEKGATVNLSVEAHSRHPLGKVELLVNGKVVDRVETDEGKHATVQHHLTLEESSWVVARASRSDSFNALDGPDIAHTSAIYLQMDGQPRIVPGAAEEWIRRMETHARDLEQNGRFQTEAQRAEAVGHVRAGIKVYQRLLEKGR